MISVKLLVLVATLLVIKVQCQDSEEVPLFVTGRVESQRRGRALVSESSCSVGETPFQSFCYDSDPCAAAPNQKIFTCNGNGAVIKGTCTASETVKCPDGATPTVYAECKGTYKYCNQYEPGVAYCTDIEPNCGSDDSTFTCTGKGLYPDPSNCQRYYNCYYDEAEYIFKPQTLTCPNLYVFDPSGKNGENCRFTNNNKNQCITFPCTTADAGKNVPIVHPWFPKALGQYILSCKTALEYEVFRCDAGYEVIPNSSPVKCSPVCKGTENIAHPLLDNKYYKCYRTAGKSQPILTPCLAGLKFDVVKRKCV